MRKKLKIPPEAPEPPVTPVRYTSGMNGIAHTCDMNRMVHIAGWLKKNEKQPSASPACPVSPASPAGRSGALCFPLAFFTNEE